MMVARTNHYTTTFQLPFLDVDMQQPAYFKPELGPVPDEETAPPQGPVRTAMPTPHWLSTIFRDSKVDQTETPEAETEADIESSTVKAYTTHPGRDLGEGEKQHVDNLRNLHQFYNSDVQVSSSLDEYFHEFLDDKGLQERNSDQVISRFIARTWWRADKDEESKKPEVDDIDGEGGSDIDDDDDKTAEPRTKSRLSLKTKENDGEGQDDEDEPEKPTEKTTLQETSRLVVEAAAAEHQSKPQLEKLNHDELRDLEKGQSPQSEPRSSFWNRNRRVEQSALDVVQVEGPPVIHDSEGKGASDSSATSLRPVKTGSAKAPNTKQTRQQLVVVPQIWLWRVGSTFQPLSAQPGYHHLTARQFN